MIIPAGSTNVSVYYYIVQDASATSPGEPVTGLLFSDIQTGGSASYTRQGAAAVSITLITLLSASAVHSDGGFILVSDTLAPGLYRCDYPDAAFAAGVSQTFCNIVIASANNALAAPILVDMDGSIAQTGDAFARLATYRLGELMSAALASQPFTASLLSDLTQDNPDAVGTQQFTVAALMRLADESLTGATHNIPNSWGRRVRQLEASFVLHAGTAQAGSSNTITFDTGANANDDFYKHAKVVVDGGPGAEQERIIVSYVGATKVATIAPPWVTQPGGTSTFVIEPGIAHAETNSKTVAVGLAQAGAATTITLAATASAVTDYYKDDLIQIDAGAGEGQARLIIAYNGITKVATVSTAWLTNPDLTSEYVIEGAMVFAANRVTANVDQINGNATSASNLQKSTLAIEPGAAVLGTLSTTQMTTDLTETTDNHYKGRIIIWTSGALINQATDIIAYTGASKLLTFTALTEAPAATDSFVIV